MKIWIKLTTQTCDASCVRLKMKVITFVWAKCPRPQREHHNGKRAFSRNVVSSGDLITTNKNILAKLDTEAQSWRG